MHQIDFTCETPKMLLKSSIAQNSQGKGVLPPDRKGNGMRAFERLLQYVQVHTSSTEVREGTPSTERQRDFAKLLEQEMTGMGFTGVSVDDHAYVYGTLPATLGLESVPAIALIAHLDTIPDEDYPGFGVKPQLIRNYQGGAVALGDSGRVLDPEMFPDLAGCIGHTLMTTDGTTVLGADDKAGIAEILTACEDLIRERIPHGRIEVCFTPDEEIGHGAALLSLERLNAAFGYTVDGGDVSELNSETFHAAGADVRFHGVNVHPGEAKGKMRNASLVAMEFHAMLPSGDQPALTEGYEGFYHLTSMRGDVESAELHYIIRDHDSAVFQARLGIMEHAAEVLNERHGEGTVMLEFRSQYRNMNEILSQVPEVLARAEKAVIAAGLNPKHVPVRGGTDGSQLSFRGLPCPNLGTGGAGFHGPYEHITAENMELAVSVLKNLVSLRDDTGNGNCDTILTRSLTSREI